MVVSTDCQCDSLYPRLSDKTLGMSAEEFLYSGRHTLIEGDCCVAWGPRLSKKEKGTENSEFTAPLLSQTLCPGCAVVTNVDGFLDLGQGNDNRTRMEPIQR